MSLQTEFGQTLIDTGVFSRDNNIEAAFLNQTINALTQAVEGCLPEERPATLMDWQVGMDGSRDDVYEIGWDEGYNAALANIKKIIRSEG